MEDLRTKAKHLKSEKSFDKAVEIYAQIYTDDSDKWLGWEYAYCLKQLGEYDEAIKICKSIYEEDKQFKYNNDLLSWLLFEKYYKNLKEKYSIKETNQLFNIAVFVSNIVKQDETSPYEKIMLKTLRILKRNLKKPEEKILIILNKLDCNKLPDSAPTYRIHDREQEYQSDKEMYYVYKTKALYDSKLYNCYCRLILSSNRRELLSVNCRKPCRLNDIPSRLSCIIKKTRIPEHI